MCDCGALMGVFFLSLRRRGGSDPLASRRQERKFGLPTLFTLPNFHWKFTCLLNR